MTGRLIVELLIIEFLSGSTTSRFSSPGIPKIRSTPSFSSAATSRSDPFLFIEEHTLAVAKPANILNLLHNSGGLLHCFRPGGTER